MYRLSQAMVHSIIRACIEASIAAESLLIALPPEIQAAVPSGNNVTTKLHNALWHVNKLAWDDDGLDPLHTMLETGRFLAENAGFRCVEPFDRCLQHLKEQPTASDVAKTRAFQNLFTRRTKQHYLRLGCRVTPSLDDTPGPFVVEHPGGFVSVVAVHCGDKDGSASAVGATIASVRDWLDTARHGSRDAQGYVVLAPTAREGDCERVIRAGLFELDYSRLEERLDVDKIGRAVGHHLGERNGPLRLSFSIVDRDRTRSSQETMAEFFRSLRARVLIIVRPRGSALEPFASELFGVCAGCFSKHGPPAPLPIGTTWQKRSVLETGCEFLSRYGVLTAPVALEQVIKEGVLCPILICDASGPSPPLMELSLIPKIREVLSLRSKAIVVFSPADHAAAQRIERTLTTLDCDTRLVRASPERA